MRFNPFVSYTPHTTGTRHSDRRRCASLLEAQSACKRGSIIDRSNPRVSESKSSCTRLSSTRESTYAAVGCCHCRCYRGLCCSPLPHAITNLYQVHQNSAFRHWLHCKECGPCRQRRKAPGISGVRHRIRVLPFNSRYFSPFDQGVYPMHTT